VVIEAGTHSRWIAEELESAQHEVIVANPRQVRLITGRKKNDLLTRDAGEAGARRSTTAQPVSIAAEAHADLSVLHRATRWSRRERR
jgi:transposase